MSSKTESDVPQDKEPGKIFVGTGLSEGSDYEWYEEEEILAER